MIHQDSRRTVEELPHPRKFYRDAAQQKRDASVYYHCDERLPRLLKLRCHFGGDGAYGYSRDVVKEIKLRDLLAADEFGNDKQSRKRPQRSQAKRKKFHFGISPLCLFILTEKISAIRDGTVLSPGQILRPCDRHIKHCP